MRITVIGPAYPLRGGIAHHVYCPNQDLTGRGHSVQLTSFRKLYPNLFSPARRSWMSAPQRSTLEPSRFSIRLIRSPGLEHSRESRVSLRMRSSFSGGNLS